MAIIKRLRQEITKFIFFGNSGTFGIFREFLGIDLLLGRYDISVIQIMLVTHIFR